MSPVRIVQLSRGVEIWFWLCSEHLEQKEAQGWEVKDVKVPLHPLTCQVCKEGQ